MPQSARGRRPRAALAALAVCALALACGRSSVASLEEIRVVQDGGGYQRSVAPLRALLSKQPDDPELNYRLGLALVRTGRQGEAIFALQKAAASDEFGLDAGLLLASSLLDMQNFEGVIAAADALLARQPSDVSALLLRGRAAANLGHGSVALESADRALALEPGSLEALALRARALMALERYDDAEATYRKAAELGAGEGPELALRSCLALAEFQGSGRKRPDAAAAGVHECLKSHADVPGGVALAAEILDRLERRDEGTELAKQALSRDGSNGTLRKLVAARLARDGHFDEAERVLTEQAQEATTAEDLLVLADVRRRGGHLEGGLAALEQALTVQPKDPEAVRFLIADVLVELGRLDEAEQRMKALEEPIYRNIVLGRIALERGDPSRALEILTRAIEQWPGNYSARIQAARAAHELGLEDRALSELREAYRAAPEQSDAALLLARLYLARGEADDALIFMLRQRENRGFASPEVYLLAARIAVAAGDGGRARSLLKELREQEGGAALAVAELAALERKRGAQAAEAVIDKAGLDLGAPENEPALRAWVQLRVERGEGRSALGRVASLAAARPDSAGLRAIEGVLLLSLGEEGPAEERLKEALARDPGHAAALAGQAELALRRGDAKRATEAFERAAASAPGVSDYAYGVARARFAAGDEPGAEAALRKVVISHPEHAPAANDLAWLLAKRGESLDLALRLAERAGRLTQSAEVQDTLGFVHWRRGDAEAARRAFEAALALRPDYATAGYHLAVVQLEAGERDAARSGLERALAGGSFPEAEEARAALARLRTP